MVIFFLDRQTDRQTDTHTDTQTQTHTDTYTQTHTDAQTDRQQKQVTRRQLFPSGVAAKIHNVEKEDNHTRTQRLSMIV